VPEQNFQRDYSRLLPCPYSSTFKLTFPSNLAVFIAPNSKPH